MHRSIPLLLMLALAPLSACQTTGLNDYARACPSVGILAQASEVTKIKPGAPKTEDNVILLAEMLPLTLSCDYQVDDSEVTVDVAIPIQVRPGPVDDGPQTLTYFVALIGPDGNMSSKRLFQLPVAAGGNAAGTYTETVAGTQIGLPENRAPYDYQMIVGFQLSADEYALNQAEPLLRP